MPTLVQSTFVNGSSADTQDISYSTLPTPGNLLLAFTYGGSFNVNDPLAMGTLVDNQDDGWRMIGWEYFLGRAVFAKFVDVASGTYTLTYNGGTGNDAHNLTILELSGAGWPDARGLHIGSTATGGATFEMADTLMPRVPMYGVKIIAHLSAQSGFGNIGTPQNGYADIASDSGIQMVEKDITDWDGTNPSWQINSGGTINSTGMVVIVPSAIVAGSPDAVLDGNLEWGRDGFPVVRQRAS